MNTKHADILAQLNIVKRKRGRPRKYLVDPPDSFEKIKFENYFNEEKRKCLRKTIKRSFKKMAIGNSLLA